MSIWQWIVDHRFLFGLMTLFGLALALGVAGWAILEIGGRSAYRKQLALIQKTGGTLELKAIIPKPGPPSSNMMATPLLAPMLSYDHSKRPSKWLNPEAFARLISPIRFSIAPEGKGPTNAPGAWRTGRVTDLALYGDYYRSARPLIGFMKDAKPAEVVLEALSEEAEDLKELRLAAKRPNAMFPVWDHCDEAGSMMWPHLAFSRRYSALASLRAIAALEQGLPGEALDEEMTAFRFIEALSAEPVVNSQVAAVLSLNSQAQAIWEGMVKHQWRGEDLKEIQGMFERLDFLTGLRNAEIGERAFADATTTLLLNETLSPAEWGRLLGDGGLSTGSVLDPLIRMPKGIVYWNLATIHSMYGEVLELAEKTRMQGWCDVNAWRASEATWQSRLVGFHPTRILARMLRPGLSTAWVKIAAGEATRRLIVASCALERYRMEKGSYPKEMSELTPKFLKAPVLDPFDGKLLKYSATGDGHYTLYSIGRDGVDGGGTVVLNKMGRSVDPDQGDIVWPSEVGPMTR